MNTAVYFKLLQDLEYKALHSGVGLPNDKPQLEQWNGIGFRLINSPLLIPIHQVLEVMTIPEYCHVFGVKPWVLGIANVRGNLLPIFDLQAYLLNKTHTEFSKSLRVLITQYKDEAQEYPIGLLVEGPLVLNNFDIESFQPSAPAEINAALSEFVTGSFRKGERNWGVFDLHLLIENNSFSRVTLEV